MRCRFKRQPSNFSLQLSELQLSTKQDVSTGTAFVFSYPFENSEALFLVTNKHVVANAVITNFFFTKTEDGQQPLIGQRVDVDAIPIVVQRYLAKNASLS